MGRTAAILAAAFVAVQCTHLITGFSFDSFNNNDDEWPFYKDYQENDWPFHTSNYYAVKENRYNNIWDKFDERMMNVGSMVDNIMDNINKPLQNNFGGNFQKKLEWSIENSLKESMDSVKNMQQKIMTDTRKIQEKNSKEQSKMLDGRDGITLLEIECNAKPKKQYIIQDNKWYSCKDPLSNTVLPVRSSDLVECKPDVCAYNAIVKYKITRDPVHPIYTDDDVVCLIKGNSNSVRQFSGVDEKTVKETCTKGDVMSLKEFNNQCGTEQKIGYYYWPNDTRLCNGKKACTMIINWKVSPSGISQSTSSGPGSSENNAFSVVSSSVSNLG